MACLLAQYNSGSMQAVVLYDYGAVVLYDYGAGQSSKMKSCPSRAVARGQNAAAASRISLPGLCNANDFTRPSVPTASFPALIHDKGH